MKKVLAVIASAAVVACASTQFLSVSFQSASAASSATSGGCVRHGNTLRCLAPGDSQVRGRATCGKDAIRVVGRFSACGISPYTYSVYRVEDGQRILIGRAWITLTHSYALRSKGAPDTKFSTRWVYTKT